MDLKGIFLLCKNHLLHLSLFHSLSISQCFLFLPYRQDSDTYYTHFEQRGIEAYIGSISCFYTTCIFVLLIRIRFIYICFEFFKNHTFNFKDHTEFLFRINKKSIIIRLIISNNDGITNYYPLIQPTPQYMACMDSVLFYLRDYSFPLLVSYNLHNIFLKYNHSLLALVS